MTGSELYVTSVVFCVYVACGLCGQDREAHTNDSQSQQQQTQRPHLDPSRQGQRVYVGNLSWNVDREQLKQHMSEVRTEVTLSQSFVPLALRAV